MFSCREAARLISESRDHRLTLVQRASLTIHLVLCRFCRRFFSDWKRLGKALRSYSQRVEADSVLPQTDLRPEARQRILQAIERKGK